MSHQGLRFNEGKLRYDLIPPYSLGKLANVLTMGAKKYSDNNWKRGLSWTQTVASLERHLQAFKSGEDYDKESGELHMAHIMCNAMFLTEFYKIYPQGDDRPHAYVQTRRIGLDIDEVLADFITAYSERYGVQTPRMWNFDYLLKDRLKELSLDHDFWMNIQPKISSSELPFEPCCYVTSRPVDTEVTEKWLAMHGFPSVPVVTVPLGGSKVDALKFHKVDIFVDDRYENFVEINKSGICCYLMNAPHNEKYDVGHKRLMSLKDLPIV